MKYRRLGNSGLSLSAVGLGSYLTYGDRLAFADSRRCILRALDLGINFFDTADSYASGEAERTLGRVLREVDRDRWVIGTKCFFPTSDAPTTGGLTRKHIAESAERSLVNLGVNHIDLLQCHRFDAETPLEETVGAMDLLVRQGKIRYWGLGRFGAEQIREACSTADACGKIRPAAHQTIYGLLNRRIEDEILAAAHRNSVGTLVYGALGQGVLSGKYGENVRPKGSRAADPEQCGTMYMLTQEFIDRSTRFKVLAAEWGRPPALLALAWCLRRPEVTTVIMGASRPEQIEENSRAGDEKLSASKIEAIEQVFRG